MAKKTTSTKAVESLSKHWKGYALVAIILFVVYRWGKNRGSKQGRVVGAVDQDQIRPGFDAAAMALKVNNNFTGWQWDGYGRKETLNDLLRLTDGELTDTYNTFNERFVDPPKSMTTVISSDWLFNETHVLREQVVGRLNRLNLV